MTAPATVSIRKAAVSDVPAIAEVIRVPTTLSTAM